MKIHLNVSKSVVGLIGRYEAEIPIDNRTHKIEEKRIILNELLRYLEPSREYIKKLNTKYDNIFFIGNNMNIRHNNELGSKKWILL